jgi:tRNA pseudouridine55 synthase
MDGFLNLDKSAGLTSHDCVAKLRRSLRMKRIGHAGTLDPAATGVLPMALGRATRLLQFLPGEKAYRATIRFGLTTTTDDLMGDSLTQHPAPHLTLEQVQAQVPQFIGQIQQVPPSYSAIQVEGQRLYDLARSGQAVVAPTRTVEVQAIEILAWNPGDYPELDVAIACGAGTYIRSIARDWGQTLGVGGTLASLRRTHSSGFDLATSLTLEQVNQQLEQSQFHPIAPPLVLASLPSLTLPADLAKRWCLGQRIALDPGQSWAAFYTPLRIQVLVSSLSEPTFLGVGDITLQENTPVLHPRMVYDNVEQT